jgi:molybdate transport system substrate-binding protein
VRRCVLLFALALAACGGADDGSEPRATDQAARPAVYAAASLREALPEIDGTAKYNFAGSNRLQMQIERGAPADVFASASPKEAEGLYESGRCTRPVAFATNVLVMLVPADGASGLRSVSSLRHGPQRRLAVGAEDVPIGAYTRTLLDRVGLASILTRHVVSNEASVSGITAKVALGSADAGFAYASDARAAGDRVRAIDLPASAQPPIQYLMCAVRRPGANTRAAQAFIDEVTGEAGRQVLTRWGFGLPAER